MYARVPQPMAQFVLKIEKLSHIMGPTPILEMVRAYGRAFTPIVFYYILDGSVLTRVIEERDLGVIITSTLSCD